MATDKANAMNTFIEKMKEQGALCFEVYTRTKRDCISVAADTFCKMQCSETGGYNETECVGCADRYTFLALMTKTLNEKKGENNGN